MLRAMPPTIHRLRALKDNYVYLLVDEREGTAAVIDPGEAAPVNAALARLGVRLRQIWNTHHHWDHTGGNEALVARTGRSRCWRRPTTSGACRRRPGASRTASAS